MAYQAIICEGTSPEQEMLLNRGLLISYWNKLVLPKRVREMWEKKFPELPGIAGV